METKQMQNVQSAQSEGTSIPRPQTGRERGVGAALRKIVKVLNPLVLKLAGTRWLPLYGVIEHRGRSSGKVYHTPVVVRPARDGFIVPMPWGERTDWYRNVKAAGECGVRWKGRNYRMSRPELITADAARGSFSAFQRAVSARVGITHYLHLHRLQRT
jgi:deazaflavin-dependent oxidoreductase (nitroreductase family)